MCSVEASRATFSAVATDVPADLRYGLADGQRRTLEEVGKVLGMTRERARQIEAEALRRLRAPEVGQHLRDYLE